jgi:hypothetical protein
MREACFTRLPMVAQKGGLDKEKKNFLNPQ